MAHHRMNLPMAQRQHQRVARHEPTVGVGLAALAPRRRSHSWAGPAGLADQQSCLTPLARRWLAKPIASKPASKVHQVAGSGTAVVNSTALKPASANCLE